MVGVLVSRRLDSTRVWLRTWTGSRWTFFSGTLVIAITLLLTASGAWPLTQRADSWWVAPAVVLLSASFAFGAASLAGARGPRAATVCDLRPVLAAGVASYIGILPPGSGTTATDLLASLGPWGLSVGQPLLALVGLLAPLLTIRDRVAAEMSLPEEGETCATCTPLPAIRNRPREQAALFEIESQGRQEPAPVALTESSEKVESHNVR